MSNEIIIRHLKDKETYLTNELNKVRLALKAFIDDNMNFGDKIYSDKINGDIPVEYNSALTYGNKVLYILSKEGKPMLVDEITEALYILEPALDAGKLHKTISYNLSMLAKYGKIKKYPFNRKIKYSV
ncbi:MAG: hypothetical protein JWP44_2998 [Mucilaginibacter sp.]|nr:hypothetical protein [Mucilaginibacter sp.]